MHQLVLRKSLTLELPHGEKIHSTECLIWPDHALSGTKKYLIDNYIDSLYGVISIFLGMVKSLPAGYFVLKLAMHTILQSNHLPISKG